MLLLKVTLILGGAIAVCVALRNRPAATRHRVWSAAFAGVLLLPLLTLALPPLSLPVPQAFVRESITPAARPVSTRQIAETFRAEPDIRKSTVAPLAPVAVPQSRAALPGWTTAQWLAAAWVMGTLLSLAALALSLWRARRLASTATPLANGDWRDAADTIASRLGLRRPVALLASPHVTTPMAGGLWRPSIFLPPCAAHWDAECRDVVLAHELSHLAARDPQRHLLARAALSLYWFHPLAWLAARDAAAAREQACDDAVLALGTRPSAYARVLVELAESLAAPPRALAALPMVHHSLLEARVMAILNCTTRRTAARRGLLPIAGITGLTLIVAAAAPGAAPVQPITVSTPSVIHAPAATPSAIPGRTAPGQRLLERDTDCWRTIPTGNFSGHRNTSEGIVLQEYGTAGAHRLMRSSLDGLKTCLIAEGVGTGVDNERPSRWLDRAQRMLMETHDGRTVSRLFIDDGQATWFVNNTVRPLDAAGREWRDRLIATLDATWQISAIHGEVTSLNGQITSIRGMETSLRGEITSLRGQVTSMRGRITSIRGEETSLRGHITSIRGHETTLRGQITSARGAITSILSSGYSRQDADRRISEYEKQIDRIEAEIRNYNADAKVAEVEKQIARTDFDKQVEAIEKQIDDFKVEEKVAAVERRIADLKVDEKVREIEKQIDGLDADKRVAAGEKQLEAERARLKSALAAVR